MNMFKMEQKSGIIDFLMQKLFMKYFSSRKDHLITRIGLDQAGSGERARAGEGAGAGKESHLPWEVVKGSSRLLAQLKAPADWKQTKPKLDPGSFIKPPLFQRNRLTGSGNPTFESYVEGKAM